MLKTFQTRASSIDLIIVVSDTLLHILVELRQRLRSGDHLRFVLKEGIPIWVFLIQMQLRESS